MKKVLKIVMALIILVLVSIILLAIDYSRIQNQGKPIFSISNPAGVINDGGTVEYFGLGYKIIDFNRLGGYNETKIGTWFMQYEDFEEEYKDFEKDVIISDFPEAVRASVEGEIIIFTGGYGGYTTKAKANTITGRFIDIYGNIYNYQIPCDENENMRIQVGRIDEEVLKEYKGDYVSTLSKEELDIILNNMNNISNEFENSHIPIADLPSSFVYIIVDGNIKILRTANGSGSVRENSSEAGKKILNVILENI